MRNLQIAVLSTPLLRMLDLILSIVYIQLSKAASVTAIIYCDELNTN